MKKIIATLLVIATAVCTLLLFSSCAPAVTPEDGLTPFIGRNGNWWIGEKDTGINASGIKGDKGDTGDAGAAGKDGASGNVGKDAVNPIFRHNVKDDCLEASYDNGATWSAFPMYPFDDYLIGGYNYPISDIQLLNGCIATIDNRYVEVDDYYGAIIPLEELDFDTVTITPSKTTNNLGYAFLKENLVVNRAPAYSEGYYEVVWTDSPDTAVISIPSDAKYLYVYYMSEDKVYLPTAVVFSNSYQ